MSKYRIVQVAPISQNKCFRVDKQEGQDVLGKPNFSTMRDSNGWAFFNTLDEAQLFIDSFKTAPIIIDNYPRVILEAEIQ